MVRKAKLSVLKTRSENQLYDRMSRLIKEENRVRDEINSKGITPSRNKILQKRMRTIEKEHVKTMKAFKSKFKKKQKGSKRWIYKT